MDPIDIVVSKAEVSTLFFLGRDARCPFHAHNPRINSYVQLIHFDAILITRYAPAWFRCVIEE